MFFSGRIFKELHEVKSKIDACREATEETLLLNQEQNVKVSVVIPTLNESEYMVNSLQSLEDGTYSNFESIVVDCLSNDNTIEIAKRLGAKIVLSNKRNRGYQTHLGFLSAEGDIVIRTDADTIFPRDVLVKTVKAFNNEKIMIYHVGHLYYDGGILLNLLAHLYDKYWRKIWKTTGHFIAVRRQVYGKVAFRFLAKNQDFDFGKRAYEFFGPEAFMYDPTTTILISSRAIRKSGILKYVLGKGGSFK